ncbi:class I SAM-dependent methyltransferase [Ureaplasma miroungigenitalium]|uniref:Class I SAM-dependent methyltransferase n=1 Tax=Ureaplasma miroungigenitalium TaxID=1042321 RepID=A0ABT3BLX9_9BACT|nr:class I SAM-dependent methyltransferase [Ureaplasma miroungigenitalium]MCV3728254.1 class I SAM-dependent methyltransferase [Ureaplasma miroungigenitalium]MCV3734058.1 class I SAM-dependent methyltransferase [Ureaplasma miroungigenitalium]
MTVNKKIQTLATLIGSSKICVDVGCDHGYLGLYLLTNKQVYFVYNIDINQGPLNQAQKNYQQADFSNQACFLLNDGLRNLEINEPDKVVCIAGMGAQLIIRILENKPKSFTRFVLNPHADVHLLRAYLYEHGYHIKMEEIIQEKTLFYFLFSCEQVNKKADYTKKDYYISRSLWASANSLYRDYLQQRYTYLSQLDLTRVNNDLREEWQYIKEVIDDERKTSFKSTGHL